MKPLNSKERSKQLWQFVFVFLGLALVPVALIFFSYYKVPEKISESEDSKLVAYSNFEHTQKAILKKMQEVDSNINLYAAANTENPKLLDKKILDGLSDLDRMDTMKLLQQVHDSYEKHYTHVTKLVEAQQKLKDMSVKLSEAEEKLKSSNNNMMGMGAMPMPPTQ
jgi:hypothetical protein